MFNVIHHEEPGPEKTTPGSIFAGKSIQLLMTRSNPNVLVTVVPSIRCESISI